MDILRAFKKIFCLTGVVLIAQAVLLSGCGVKEQPQENNTLKEKVKHQENVAQVKRTDTGQVRNNRIEIDPRRLWGYLQDPEFESFNELEVLDSRQEYQKRLIREGEKKGIPSKRLSVALTALQKEYGKHLTILPVVIETAKYKGKDAFLVLCKWEYNAPSLDKSLTHVSVVVVEEGTGKILQIKTCR